MRWDRRARSWWPCARASCSAVGRRRRISLDEATSPTPQASIPTVAPQVSPASSEEPIAAAYEAVFLRLEVADGSPEVLAIGVDAAGQEREIARLPDAWVAYALPDGGYLAPIGAVSPSGLLAIPVRADDSDAPLPKMRWEIFDLHQPEAAPIVVPGIEQGLEELGLGPYLTKDPEPSVHWAAGERLGIPWHSCDFDLLRRLGLLRWAHRRGDPAPAARRGQLPHARPGWSGRHGLRRWRRPT